MEWFRGLLPVTIAVLQCIVVDAQTSVFDITCSFEVDLCGWTSVNLTRTQYPTAFADSRVSGPTKAEDRLFYVYLDTSGQKHKDNYTGSLNRDSLNVPAGSGDVCLRFWYHMFGDTMGSLLVLVDDNEVWSKDGNQSDVWHCAAVDIATLQSKISFKATMGDDIHSIIALDNIKVFSTACIQDGCENIYESTIVEPETPQPSTTTPTTPTLSVDTTTAAPTQINLDEYIPYIAGVPAGILIIGAVILIICLKRQNLTKSPEPLMVIPTSNNMYGGFPHDPISQINEAAEEVYTDIDEFAMVSTGSLNTGNGKTVDNPYDEADTKPSSEDYVAPMNQNGQPVVNQEGDDYLTPTDRRSGVISGGNVTSDDDYITPINNQDGPRRMSSVNTRREPVDVKDMHRASITSAGTNVDSDDYLVLTATKGKKGSADLAFSLRQ